MNPLTRRRFLHQAATGAATLAIAATSARADERSLAVLFFGGDLPDVLRDLEKEHRVAALKGGETKDKQVAGLEQLERAHLFIGSVNKRITPSDAQLGHFKRYFESGKPIVGYRAASHVFQNWLIIDREVFGAKYGGHHHKDNDPRMQIEIAAGAKEHPILQGLTPPKPISGSYVYTEIAAEVTILLRSGFPGDFMPHTWVRQHARTKGRVFYTRYDARQIAADATARQIFLRGIAWALGGDLARYRKKA